MRVKILQIKLALHINKNCVYYTATEQEKETSKLLFVNYSIKSTST